MKICFHCKEEKALKDFTKCSSAKDGLYSYCRTCKNELQLSQHKEWRDANRDHLRSYGRKQGLKRDMSKIRYNVSKEDREKIFSAQGRCCAICGRDTPVGKYWHLDHNHITGQIRSILCMDCNMIVGKVENGWKVEVPAISEYLEFFFQQGGGLDALEC